MGRHAKPHVTKRLLVTIPQDVVEELESVRDLTSWTKSQLITLCVRRSLGDVAKGYKRTKPNIEK